MPKLSIIVPVYDVEQYIHKCVDSILNQTFRDFELILVDDGSPDNCGAICDEYAKKDNRVKVIHKENGGVSVARNFGLKESKGDYISFVDPDDWIEKELYSEVLDYMYVNQLDIACFDFYIIRDNKKTIEHTFSDNKIFSKKEALVEFLNGNMGGVLWNKLFKKDCWANVYLPQGRNFEDEATIYKTIFNVQKVGYIRKAYYYYLKRVGSAMYLSSRVDRRYDRFLAFYERWEFAKIYCREVEEKCKTLAVKTALSTVTAKYGCRSRILSSAQQKKLEEFLLEINNVKHLNVKNKILLWGAKHCALINIIYAKISYWFKNVK